MDFLRTFRFINFLKKYGGKFKRISRKLGGRNKNNNAEQEALYYIKNKNMIVKIQNY